MSGNIQILDGQHDSYTAKEAMQHAVEYLQSETAHAIQIITFEHGKEPESEAELFVKMFGRFLHKSQGKVFLFAETETLLSKMIEVLPERYTGIRIVEMATLDEPGISDDMILNRINGGEADCIFAALSDPVQEEFISRYRTSLDAKIWIGLGTRLKNRKKRWDFRKLWKRFIRQFEHRNGK